MSARFIYPFGQGTPEQSSEALFGPRGASLMEISRLGLPTPPGFAISTEAGRQIEAQATLPAGLEDQIRAAVLDLERHTGRSFGRGDRPLLLGLRLSSEVILPSFGASVFNMGLNQDTLDALARERGERFALDCQRRLLSSYGGAVLRARRPGQGIDPFLRIYRTVLERSGLDEPSLEDLRAIVDASTAFIAERGRAPMPSDPWAQLFEAVRVALTAWHSARTKRVLRRTRLHDEGVGLSILLSSMVYGSLGESAGIGFVTTRDVSTGERALRGEFMPSCESGDLRRGGLSAHSVSGLDEPSLEQAHPELYARLASSCQQLEAHFKDVQQVEFVVEDGQLWIVETKRARRNPKAALQIAVDLVRDGVIEPKEALLLVEPEHFEAHIRPALDVGDQQQQLFARGLPASPGAATGKAVFSADEAEARTKRGEKVILVRIETTPEDVYGVRLAQATLTRYGGLTSHAAVVARTLGKPCVVGAKDVHIDDQNRLMRAPSGVVVAEGETITLDGSSGEIYVGELSGVQVNAPDVFDELIAWADEVRTIAIRANADTAADARLARKLGGEGIGLCRTEHMFFERDRVPILRELILVTEPEERQAALQKIESAQKRDFRDLFEVMAGTPVAVRLLDPPLHELIPSDDAQLLRVAADLDRDPEWIRSRVRALHEGNPMLGLRGVRLGLLFPEVYAAQLRALLSAALSVQAEGKAVELEIIVPFVAFAEEMARVRAEIEAVAESVFGEGGPRLPVRVGSMIETPRAALTAERIAEFADFFSFGTNDLTQMTLGFSRDDSGRFVPAYLEQGILSADPFARLDTEGVGLLLEMAAHKGRSTRPDLGLGLCGEQAVEVGAITLCLDLGLDYVSCSPYRIPGAKIAAAQAALRRGQR